MAAVELELSGADICQILDALMIRRDAWRNAVDVEEGRDEASIGFSDPDFYNVAEAMKIIAHYEELIMKLEGLPVGDLRLTATK